MFDNHAQKVVLYEPSPLSLPFVPLRNVSPHSTTVVVRSVRFVCFVGSAATVAAVADEADAAAAVAAGRC